MSTITAESMLQLIEQMPLSEQLKLKQLMAQRVEPQPKQLDKHLQPKPIPDSTREMRWLAEHQREYVGQWVALDGDRLIAASPNHEEVAAAADADGAYLPLFTYIDDPDKVYAGF
ncbi:MAG: hypothetical protein JNM09_15120 [Blastocatellia bacterium]|nr:hypothetical protein [Blastocatellia bacterium]